MSFASLKKNKKSRFEKLQKRVESKNNKDRSDDRFWKLERNKDENGTARIRFLPPKGEDYNFVTMFNHVVKRKNDKGKDQYFWENCPTTIEANGGEKHDCPCCNHYLENWADNKEAKEYANQFKRKTRYLMNIYVIEDKQNPDNEGKVFLFDCPPSVYEHIKTAIKPEFEDEESFDPFCMWEGADFNIRVYRDTQKNMLSYDKSKFLKNAPLKKKDEELEEIYEQTFPLEEFISPDNFKSFEALTKRFNSFLEATGGKASNNSFNTQQEESVEEDVPSIDDVESDDDMDDVIAAFQKQVEDD